MSVLTRSGSTGVVVGRSAEASTSGPAFVRTKAGPDVLASADRPTTTPVDPLRVKTLIDFASRHYRYTVLDIPRSDAGVLDSLEACRTIAVIVRSEEHTSELQ